MKEHESKIANYIDANGPITFAKFVEFALYDEQYGYYNRHSEKFGKSGDFYTSPTVHKVFGQIISNLVSKYFVLNKQSPLTVIELGSGLGYIALDVLDNLKESNDELYSKLAYICIESSPQNVEKSKEILSTHSGKLIWSANLSEIDKCDNAIVLSNEFFDALPFHRVIFKDQRPYEIYVQTGENGFSESISDLSCEKIYQYIEKLNLVFEENQQIEVNLNYRDVIQQISKVIDKGLIVTFDYGYLKEELYSPQRLNGTYRCFYNHKISSEPYNNIGEQDITSSVNFSSLINLGREMGFEVIKYTTQGQFLVDWGILDLVEQSSESDRSIIKNLFLPSTMGDMFKVLIQQKNLQDLAIQLYPESILKISYQSTKDRI